MTTERCRVLGCRGWVYQNGRCSTHWEGRPPERTCDHYPAVLILCGVCGRRVCEECWGPWNALACQKCRERARASG